MKKANVNLLIVDDNDFECSKEKPTLKDVDISKLSFSMADLKRFEVIIYRGKLGTKVIKLSTGSSGS